MVGVKNAWLEVEWWWKRVGGGSKCVVGVKNACWVSKTHALDK
jgi:hypothetical protein